MQVWLLRVITSTSTLDKATGRVSSGGFGKSVGKMPSREEEQHAQWKNADLGVREAGCGTLLGHMPVEGHRASH